MTTDHPPTTAPGHDDPPGRDTEARPGQRTTGRWAMLAPIRPQDYDHLRLLELSDRLGVTWRLRGITPSPERWAQTLWQGVLAQYLVVRRTDGELMGLVCAYDADLQDGTCSVGFVRFHDGTSPTMGEGVMLFVDHLFAQWPFRKLCGESLECNLAAFSSSLSGLLVEEGRRVAQRYVDGRYWDLVHIALWRDTWTAARPRLLPAEASEWPVDPAGAVVHVAVPG